MEAPEAACHRQDLQEGAPTLGMGILPTSWPQIRQEILIRLQEALQEALLLVPALRLEAPFEEGYA